MILATAAPITPSLTRRETEVLLLICDGKRAKQISTELGITVKTVACHRSRVLEKLGVPNVASLVRHAVRLGYLVA